MFHLMITEDDGWRRLMVNGKWYEGAAKSPGESLGDTGDLAGPVLGFKALLLTSEALTWVQGNWWQPPGVCWPVPERSEEVRDKDGEVVAPEPVVFIALECSGVCLPIAQRILFPFIPIGTVMEKKNHVGRDHQKQEEKGQQHRGRVDLVQ